MMVCVTKVYGIAGVRSPPVARQAEQPHRLVESSTGTPVRLLASRGKAWRATVAGRYDDRLKPVPSAACAVPRM